MHTFYCPELLNGVNSLSKEESHHCAKVLRLKESDSVRIINGKGTVAMAELTEIHAKEVHFNIIEQNTFANKKGKLSIAIAPTKSIDRFEFFIEKAVELGVDRIIPLICDRSERKNLRHDRMQKNVLSATKQSMRAFLPIMDELTPLRDLEDLIRSQSTFIAHCEEHEKTKISDINSREVLILVGPEGDFSPKEISYTTQWGAKALDLGKNRLRTETAGIFVVACLGSVLTE